ncbi:GNAT family N-acetyltransferase [Aquimixticola soesokkakensis]|nr:GNAT family N-acetyltransferase [Aquimixticola soesokkakensis]
MLIRDVQTRDIEALRAIMAPVIRETTASFSDEERSPEGWRAMIAARAEADRPFVVAEIDGICAGYATYDQFRAGNSGYRFTMEHSVYLAPVAQGKGAGRALMHRLEEHARRHDIHSLIAGIDAQNIGSIAFHQALGFEKSGLVAQSGYKFGRWLDLQFMQKFL